MKLKKIIINGEVFYKEVAEDEEINEVEIVKEENEILNDENFEKLDVTSENDNINNDFDDDNNDEDDNDEDDEDDDDDDDEDDEDNYYNYKNIYHMIPFMSKEDIDKIVQKILSNEKEYQYLKLTAFYPFISRDLCNNLFLKFAKTGNDKELKRILPFVSSNVLTQFVDEYINSNIPRFKMNFIYPFLSDKDLKKLFNYEMNRKFK